MTINRLLITGFQTSLAPALKGGKFEIVLVPFRARAEQGYFKQLEARNNSIVVWVWDLNG